MTDLALLDKPVAPASRPEVAAFPTRGMVASAVGLFTGAPLRERELGCTVVPAGEQITEAKSRELWPERYADRATGLLLEPARRRAPRVAGQVDRELLEGPQWRVMVGPGIVAVRRQDPVRVERAAQRAVEALRRKREMGLADHDNSRGACVTAWSSKSRARMVETINSLDLSPLVRGGEGAAGVTLTYPGDWLAVAPEADVCRRHVDALRARYRRRFGEQLRGLWKREFQDRGAPHYHIWTVKPAGVGWREYREWFASTWPAIVGAESCGRPASECGRSCERHRHEAAGIGVERYAGRRASDPNMVAVYFSKHGSFAAKDYQNHAPAEWVATGRVGRFWGYWGLERAIGGVLVQADDGITAARVLRRHSRANSYVAPVPAWKYRTVVDLDTGEVSAKWRKGTRRQRIYRMRHGAGYVVTSSGPALASDLARALDARKPAPPDREGRPKGFLP